MSGEYHINFVNIHAFGVRIWELRRSGCSQNLLEAGIEACLRVKLEPEEARVNFWRLMAKRIESWRRILIIEKGDLGML